MWVPQHLVQEANRGDSVGHSVVDACRNRLPTVGERADDVEGPQWARTVEVFGHQGADGAPEVGLRPAVQTGPEAYVVANVESAGRDPARTRLGGVDPLHRTRLTRKTLRHSGSQVIDVERPGARLEDDELEGVAGDDRRFETEDARVVLGQPIGILADHCRQSTARLAVAGGIMA